MFGKTAPNPVLMNLPYRERVMHLLALRPYKKPELIFRLQKDGIRKKDKNSLGELLKSVATLNLKNNSYTLMNHLYKDIRQDWPGYSDVDRTILKREMRIL